MVLIYFNDIKLRICPSQALMRPARPGAYRSSVAEGRAIRIRQVLDAWTMLDEIDRQRVALPAPDKIGMSLSVFVAVEAGALRPAG